MDQADVVMDVGLEIVSRELQRGQFTRPGEFVVFVLPLPVDLCGRRAQVDAQHVIDDFQSLIFNSAKFVQA